MALYSFGEILYDIYPTRKCIGGAPLNFAAHFALQGNECFMISAVGSDVNGREALEWMHLKNIRTDYVKISGKPTGACIVSLDEAGLPSYQLQTDTAWDDIDAPEKTAFEGSSAENPPVLYFGTLALRSEHNFSALRSILQSQSFREVFADINIRPPFSTKEAIRFAMENATILKISREELQETAAAIGMDCPPDDTDVLRPIANMFPHLKLVILTLGEDGSCAYHKGTNTCYRCPAVPTAVVSTVGAGDSFSAAFLSEYLKGRPVDICLAHASAAASAVCAKLDAVP